MWRRSATGETFDIGRNPHLLIKTSRSPPLFPMSGHLTLTQRRWRRRWGYYYRTRRLSTKNPPKKCAKNSSDADSRPPIPSVGICQISQWWRRHQHTQDSEQDNQTFFHPILLSDTGNHSRLLGSCCCSKCVPKK